jgi:ketosteroid isomerase-like protein
LAVIRARYIGAIASADLDALMRLHTAATIHLPSGRPPVVGQDAVRGLMQASLQHLPADFRFHFEPAEVRMGDNLAVEWGVTPGAPGFPGGKYMMLYEWEEDGGWRIAWTMSNFDGPPG